MSDVFVPTPALARKCCGVSPNVETDRGFAYGDNEAGDGPGFEWLIQCPRCNAYEKAGNLPELLRRWGTIAPESC